MGASAAHGALSLYTRSPHTSPLGPCRRPLSLSPCSLLQWLLSYFRQHPCWWDRGCVSGPLSGPPRRQGRAGQQVSQVLGPTGQPACIQYTCACPWVWTVTGWSSFRMRGGFAGKTKLGLFQFLSFKKKHCAKRQIVWLSLQGAHHLPSIPCPQQSTLLKSRPLASEASVGLK